MVIGIPTPTQETARRLKLFVQDESGAVTADWVVLTAAGVTLALVVATSVGLGTVTAAETIEDGLEDGSRTIFCGDQPCG